MQVGGGARRVPQQGGKVGRGRGRACPDRARVLPTQTANEKLWGTCRWDARGPGGGGEGGRDWAVVGWKLAW